VDPHRLRRPAELRAGGFTNGEVRQFLRDGALTRVRRGTYLLGSAPDEAAARHTLAVQAALRELAAEALALRAGVLVTSVARTVVDLARSVPFEEAVVVADAALAGGLVDRAELEQAVRRAQRWPGVPAARR
jgi:hypothetical protein